MERENNILTEMQRATAMKELLSNMFNIGYEQVVSHLNTMRLSIKDKRDVAQFIKRKFEYGYPIPRNCYSIRKYLPDMPLDFFKESDIQIVEDFLKRLKDSVN